MTLHLTAAQIVLAAALVSVTLLAGCRREEAAYDSAPMKLGAPAHQSSADR